MMKINKALFLFGFCCVVNISTAKKTPSFEEIISLHSISNPQISPNGNYVVFEKRTTDWKNNRFDTELWLSKSGDQAFQLSHNLKSNSRNPKWSPNNKWIAFLSKTGKKTQIRVIRVAGGESFQVTNSKNNISDFEWSPDGKQILFQQAEDKTKQIDKRKESYGSYAIEDEEYSVNQLWLIDFNPDSLNESPLPEQLKDEAYKSKGIAKQLMPDETFSITSFMWSPNGTKIAFSHQPDSLINSFFHSDVSVYDTQSKSHKVLVNNSSFDGFLDWSVDGKSLLYTTSLDNDESNYYSNSKLFRINLDGSGNKQLAQEFDERINQIQWNKSGIFGIAWYKTERSLIRIDSLTGKVRRLSKKPSRINAYSFSADGKKVSYVAQGADDLSELYGANYPLRKVKKLSSMSTQLESWNVASSEVISWESKDGNIIEGVLHKPQDYDPNIKYPLMVVIHGGPTGISTPSPVPAYVYPMVQWLNKGALILRPNYRGSAGYGEKFRSLNVKNLGVGDAWDVLSGIDYLERKGIIDGNKVASMGWSQGGYISAFLSTNSEKFKAISVGAGISNWMTYYVNTDIHPFTRQYLKATPWSDKDIYEKTSPMTNINQAKTPTLIQHGELDKRVPIANAYELFQGLKDVGVETELIVYKGFGHGISKPKERLAAMWHNWQWFGKYIWNEEIELPLDEDESADDSADSEEEES